MGFLLLLSLIDLITSAMFSKQNVGCFCFLFFKFCVTSKPSRYEKP